MPPIDDVLILTGPTGSGKTALALALADTLNAEIISADSMTNYRGMDIGTAKPSAEEQARVPHHLLDWLEPWESADVAQWLARVTMVRNDLRERGKRALFVGGTPFYLQALRYGLFPGPPSDPALRLKLEAEGKEMGVTAFHAQLKAVDPIAAQRIHANDTRRVVRALEVFALTGKPISSFQTTWQTSGFASDGIALPWRCVVLDWPREELYQRINTRVETMLAQGWLDECRQLLKLGQPLSREAGQALGYQDLFAHLAGGPGLAETIGLIQIRTRQFAKRQMTWFRNMGQTVWLPATEVGKITSVFSSEFVR